jgi:hypothetical protein
LKALLNFQTNPYIGVVLSWLGIADKSNQISFAIAIDICGSTNFISLAKKSFHLLGRANFLKRSSVGSGCVDVGVLAAGILVEVAVAVCGGVDVNVAVDTSNRSVRPGLGDCSTLGKGEGGIFPLNTITPTITVIAPNITVTVTIDALPMIRLRGKDFWGRGTDDGVVAIGFKSFGASTVEIVGGNGSRRFIAKLFQQLLGSLDAIIEFHFSKINILESPQSQRNSTFFQ